MKIKLITDVILSGDPAYTFKAGDIVDLIDEIAYKLIRRKRAIEFVETAAISKGRKKNASASTVQKQSMEND